MDFNGTEIVVLVVLAIIVFGPERLPELARKLARVISYLRRIGNDARGQLREELGPEFDNIHLADLNPKSFVARHVLSEDEKSDLLSIRDELTETRDLARTSVADARGATRASRAGGADDVHDRVSDEPTDDTVDSEFLRAVAYDPEAT